MSTVNPSSDPPLYANEEASEDPTETKTLREREVASYAALWAAVRGVLRDTIEHNDALRLRDKDYGPTKAAPIGGYRGERIEDFGAETNAERLARFTAWYRAVLDRHVLEPLDTEAVRRGDHYSAQAVRRAYARGLALANRDLRRSSLPDPDTGEEGNENPSDLISDDRHQDQLGQLFTQIYGDVERASDETHTQTTRRLGEDLGIFAAGALTLRELTNGLIDRVKAVGENRTRTTANTRVVQSVNKAIIERGAAVGVEEVGAKVELSITGPHEGLPDGVDPEDVEPEDEPREEWTTAKDDRVCPRCSALAGQRWRVSDVRAGRTPQPPIHPVCRCRLVLIG